MVQPINYMVPQQPVADAFAPVAQGFQLGSAILQQRQQQEDARQAAALQEQMQADFGALGASPSPAAVARLMVKYPQMSEQLKRGYDALSSEQQKASTAQIGQVYAAIRAGRTDLAKQMITDGITAAENSGDTQAANAGKSMLRLLDEAPQAAELTGATFLAAALGPDKFAETYGKLGSERRAEEVQGATMLEKQASAKKAAIEAAYAESNALLDLEKKGWDIQKLRADIANQAETNRIALLNAQLSRETNELKKTELEQKLDDAKSARETKLRERTADLEAGRQSVDNMLNTIDRVMAVDMDTLESIAGPISSRMPTLSQDAADAEELIQTLGSQAFLAQIPNIKGMGALSNAEGEKLQAALQNFSLRQSPKQLRANMEEAQRLILKARKNMAERYGAPETVPDTPAAVYATSPEDIEALIQKYAGGQ